MFSVFSRENQPATYSILHPLLRELDEMFDAQTSQQQGLTNTERVNFNLACEMDETDAHYVMSFDIPGVRREDVCIELDGSHLVVSGERKVECRSNLQRHGKFKKSFRLPEGVKAESIVAEHKDGVLRVAIEKPTTVKKTKIKIADGSNVARTGGFFKNLVSDKKAKESAEVKGATAKDESMSLAN